MSWVNDRVDIADALSLVAGVTGHAWRPSVIASGSAWPVLQRAERRPGQTFEAHWKVYVALSGDEVSATARVDDLLAGLLTALEPVAYVSDVAPVVLATGSGDLYGLEITAISE